MINVIRSCQSAWSKVCEKVNKAVVFIDNPSAECLHWNGGATLLFNAGATDVKEFSSFESGGKNQRKAVFILSSPLHGVTTDIIQDVLKGSSFHYIILVSGLSQHMHSKILFGTHENEDKAFHHVEEQLLQWMGNMNYTAEVVYIPIVAAPVTSSMFVLPAHSTLFPLLPSDISTLVKRQAAQSEQQPSACDVDFTYFDRELQLAMKLLVCSLNSMLETLGVTEDCFALGHTSRIIATELACLQWAKNRRKSANQKASLLLVDRTLDVASAAGHHSETLLDKILSLLPRLPNHNNDVCTNMLPLCACHGSTNPSVILPGCLAHQTDPESQALLSSLVTSRQKEALMEVNRSVVEAASTENLPLKLTGKPGRITAAQLEGHLALFRGKTNAVKKHSGILQIAQATVESMKHPNFTESDQLLGVEKGLLQCIGDPDSPSPLSQIINMLQQDLQKPPQERTHSLDDILLLLVYMYSLAGEEYPPDPQEETTLQSALTDAILNEEKVPDLINQIVQRPNNPDVVFSRVQEIFQKLRGLRMAREGMKHFRKNYKPGGLTSPASLQPIAKELIDEIFSPQKPELPDIIHKSTGFNLLKSGIGLFMKTGKPRPSDHSLLIVFVIGGMTASEIRQIKEAVSVAKTNVQVIVGSTSLLTHTDILKRIFVQDNLHPIRVT